MASLEEQNAQLLESIAAFEQKEASTRETFDAMKTRLKEALDEKRDFEIEFLQLQKNYLKLKNQAKAENSQPSAADREKMNKLLASNHKAEEEAKVLREDNDMLKRQNKDLSEQYRDQARRFDQDQGIDQLSDDYIDSFKKQIENLTQLLERKDQQLAELMSKNGQLKGYANELKEDLEKKYTAEGKVMPRDLQDAPVALSPRNERSIAEELRKSMDRREEILQTGRIEQLEAENEMLKEQIKKGGPPNGEEMLANAEEKARLLQQQVEDKEAKLQEVLDEKEELQKNLENTERDQGNEISMKDQEIKAQQAQLERVEKELEYARESAALQKQILDEVQKLKESPLKGIDTMDNDALREERDRLLDENAQMRINGPVSGKGEDGGSSTVRYLRSKIYHFEKTVERLEKERSQLTVRATMAEEQLKVLQTHMQQQTLSQIRQITDLKQQLQSYQQPGVIPTH